MLNFKENYTLENEFVKLSPLQLTDFDKLVYFSINEPELWQHSLISASSESNLKKYLELAVSDRDNGKAYPFIVFDKRAGKYAGSTRFHDIQNNQLTLQLGYT